MKRLYAIMFAAVAFSCNNAQNNNPGNVANNPIVNEGGNAGDSSAAGRKLIAGNDCSGCHTIANNLTGPPFIEISKRYSNSPGVAENLARSIISGSKGVFQNIREMPPHPNVRFLDAVKMAAYILSLKDQATRDSLNNVK